MRGISFQKPLELTLEVQGERWNQGDPIAGTLTVKNHGTEAFSAGALRLLFADGTIKKVHAKAAGAYEILATAELGARNVAAGEAAAFPWKFETDRNALITDVSSSPFLVFGTAPALEGLAPLQLEVRPYPLFTEIFDMIRITFRFSLKSVKNAKHGVEAKFDPPEGRGYPGIETLAIALKFDGEDLDIHYGLFLKKVGATAASVAISKGKKELNQTLAPTQYRVSSGRTHHESIESAIREVLSQYEGRIAGA